MDDPWLGRAWVVVKLVAIAILSPPAAMLVGAWRGMAEIVADAPCFYRDLWRSARIEWRNCAR
jgi:hypothetical protein